MTSLEIYHQEAIKALNSGLLNEKQKQFIERIKDLDKRQLKKLPGAEFKWLKDIAKIHIKNDQTGNLPEEGS
ncbi:hypothetical protein D3H65_11945 [Paraflavitalea soli]|uniref:Uncharacterized protein n=1 Tax=Paraflavitalea soli TaxID=2315862 RepID=A0A3B7MKE3_9BACT|nr:hypothetical protein D3H65_11945 [Paraflavitalea soli]